MPAATATDVHALNTADWTFPESMMMQFGDADLVTASCPCFLIEHPEATVLFDAGISHELVADPGEYGPHGAAHMADFLETLELEAPVVEQLADLGFEPGDVEHVVLSHLHTDHAGNVDRFPDAEVHVHVDELRYAWWPDPAQDPFYLDGDLAALRAPDATVTEVSGRTDLLGDGSVEIVPTPGHSPGHQSLVVDLGDETVILAGDVANLRAGYERGLVAPFSWSAAEAIDSLRSIECEARERDATVVVHHERDDLERLR
ncbi:N-acyl homoserine lactonase family protein [Halovivax sp.]|uniref:N-acyl homoserine lactonase family protein n=1 Tax=Halovivax sp. TaxID=1935978 RepID=UPI0025BA84E5|nr:N-acyl homoserine lactonase family protein [Halovivax sp.]